MILSVQKIVLAADCPPIKVGKVDFPATPRKSSGPLLLRLDVKQQEPIAEEDSPKDGNDKDLRVALLMYNGYLEKYRQNVERILRMTRVTEKDLPLIQQVVSKAVRDLCTSEILAFSPSKRETVKVPKDNARLILKRLLDHLAFCSERENDNELDFSNVVVQIKLQKIIKDVSLSLISCEGYSDTFDMGTINPYSSIRSPKLSEARRKSIVAVSAADAEIRKNPEKSVNFVKQISSKDDGVVAYTKPCADKAEYAEPENKPFAGINEKWIALFSARHKHKLNFHVPAISIDNERQEFSATPEGFASLAKLHGEDLERVIKKMPLDLIQRYFVLDLLFNFSDAHLGNIQVGKNAFDEYYLISIDHGDAIQIFYERPGTATLRFSNFLELFARQSEQPITYRIREFLKSLDPKVEVEFMRAQLRDDVKSIVGVEETLIQQYFNRKLDHFQLNLVFLKALATIHDSSFSDAFELRRGQFKPSIFRNPDSRRCVRYIRDFFVKESLVQNAIDLIRSTDNEAVWKEQLSAFRQMEPSFRHLLTESEQAEYAKFVVPQEKPTVVDSRLDEKFFESFDKVTRQILFPLVRSKTYHRMTDEEIQAYQSIGF